MPKKIKNIQEKKEFLENIANNIMLWMGSIPSLLIHTLLFIICFLLPVIGWVNFDKMLLTLTTVLSLEAIYLSLFIQMSVNKSQEHIEDLQDDVTEIQEDIEDIQEDIEEISEDIEEISEDIEEIQEDIEEISEEDDENDDPTERAKNVMLKSDIHNNKNQIRDLKRQIMILTQELEKLNEKS